MGSVPTELSGELSRLEQIFTVDQKKLKEITERFIEELEDGKNKYVSDHCRYITSSLTTMQLCLPDYGLFSS